MVNAPPGERLRDPYLSFRFKVEIKQLMVGGFTEASGLGFETQVETFREGGDNLYEQQLAGPTKNPSRLTLKRGLGDRDALWSWYQRVIQGRIQRMDISVLLLDRSIDKELMRWNFLKACPVKWTGPDLRAGTAEVAFESIEFIHNGPFLMK